MEGKNYPLPSHLAQKRQVALAQCQGAILQKVALANQRRMWTLIKSKVTSLKKKLTDAMSSFVTNLSLRRCLSLTGPAFSWKHAALFISQECEAAFGCREGKMPLCNS